MALFIGMQTKCITWHIGNKIATDNAKLISTLSDEKQVISVSADNDELEFIKSHFTNLPMHNGRIITWYGDDARFIASNLYSVQLFNQK